MYRRSTTPLRRLSVPAIAASILATTLYTPLALAQLEEVIVTAQLTDQSRQDVPVAVTAFTGDDPPEVFEDAPCECPDTDFS